MSIKDIQKGRKAGDVVTAEYVQKWIDLCYELEAKLAIADDGWHMANGTADLAMKHRDEAEAKLAAVKALADFPVPHAPAGARGVWLSDIKEALE
jgi:hypothetical protein